MSPILTMYAPKALTKSTINGLTNPSFRCICGKISSIEDSYSGKRADKCLDPLNFPPHTVFPLMQIRACDLFCCHCMKKSCNSITKCFRSKAPRHHYLSMHLKCDLHQHSKAITQGGKDTHTHKHTPSRSSSGAWM